MFCYTKKHKIVVSLVIAVLLCAVVVTPAFALVYLANIYLNNTTATDYDMFPALATVNVTHLVDTSIVSYTANDTSVLVAGIPIPRLLADDKLLFATPLPPSTTVLAEFYTGQIPSVMDVITGIGGYYTITDNLSLEPTDNVSIETNTYLTGADDIIHKQDAILIERSATDNVSVTINGTRQQYYVVNDDAIQAINSTTWAAQAFTTENVTYQVDKVKLKLYRTLTPGLITVSIRETALGVPTGADLTTGTYDGDSITDASPGLWYTIDVVNLSLAPATQYAVIVNVAGAGGGNDLNWRSDDTAPTYPGGWASLSVNSGVAWTANSGRDFMFEIISPDITWDSVAETDAEHTIIFTKDTIFNSLGVDSSSTPITPVTEGLVDNIPLWQPECVNTTFYTIDYNGLLATTHNNPIWTINQGRSFDGVNQYIDIAAAPVSANISISAWVKQNDPNNVATQFILWGWTDGQFGFFQNNGVLYYDSSRVGGASITTALADTDWHYYTLTHNATTGERVAYLDATPVGNDAVGIAIAEIRPVLGRRGSLNQDYGNVIIGEAIIYNTVLTQTEITQNYNATIAKFTSGDIYTYSSMPDIPDNANDWVVGSDATPYIEYYKHYVGGNLAAWHQPDRYIQGTVLPDRSIGNPGDIAWGSNPAGVTANVSPMVYVSSGYLVSSLRPEGDVVGETGEPTDLYPDDEDMAGTGITWLYPIVRDLATLTDTPIGIFWWFLCLVSIICSMGSVVKYTQNLFLMVVACIVTVAINVSMLLIQPWFIIIVALIGLGALVLEKKQAF